MPTRSVFMDTSYVIALVNSDDPHHDRAKVVDQELLDEDAQIILHWGILLEIGDGFSGLERRQKGAELIDRILDESAYTVVEFSTGLLTHALDLFRHRQDKSWGLTDCTSFVVMEQMAIPEALTADQHFVQAGFRALLLE